MEHSRSCFFSKFTNDLVYYKPRQFFTKEYSIIVIIDKFWIKSLPHSRIFFYKIQFIIAGVPTSDDDVAAQNGVENMLGSFPDVEANSILAGAPEKDEKMDFDTADCVIKCKSVFKCRLCPRIVCLSEDTIKAHLNSKASVYIYIRLSSILYQLFVNFIRNFLIETIFFQLFAYLSFCFDLVFFSPKIVCHGHQKWFNLHNILWNH